MSEERTQARTKIEFIYNEIIGDLDDLVTRIEDTRKDLDQLQATNNTIKEVLDNFPSNLYKSLQESSNVIAKNAAISIGETLSDSEKNLIDLSKHVANYAAITNTSARKMTVIALVIGASSGILGGLLAGIALSQL